LEALVIDVLLRHLQANGSDPKPISETDRELIERRLLRVTLSAKEVRLHLCQNGDSDSPAAGQDDARFAGADLMSEIITVPWTVLAAAPVKGIVYVPAHNTPMNPGSREVLMIAIAKARKWIKDVERGHRFADIARQEGKSRRAAVRQLPC
jgi:hypothetical protein